jgi:hypothetical protein
MHASEAINVDYYTDICAKPYLYPVPTAQSHTSTHDIEVNTLEQPRENATRRSVVKRPEGV